MKSKDNNNNKQNSGFWTWLGKSFRLIFASTRRCKVMIVIGTIIFIVLVPIAFAYIIDAPALVDYVPFESVDWFGYWASYLSLVSTIFLDCFALFFALTAYNNERQYKKYGMLYFNSMILNYSYCGDNRYKFKIELIDFHPNLTHHHNISLENFKIYAVKNKEILKNPKLLNNADIKEQAVDLIYSQNSSSISDFDYFSKSSNEKYSLFLSCESIQIFLNEYFNFKTFSEDKKMLFITYDYVITSKDLGRYNRFLNALFPSSKNRTEMLLIQKKCEVNSPNTKVYSIVDERTETI